MVSASPVHQEVVNILCVSDSDCRSPKCRSCVIRIQKAMPTGSAMMRKVQLIQAVLCTVRKRVSGKMYRGIGPRIETAAIKLMVSGKPRDDGHQLRLYRLKTLVIHIKAVKL